MSVSVYIENESSLADYNVANGNWTRMNELLGTDLDYCGRLEGSALTEFRDKIAFALNGVTFMPELDGGLQSVETVGSGGCRMIECGLPEGYWKARLTALLAIINKAITESKPVCWC